jgi:hypothetical protein
MKMMKRPQASDRQTQNATPAAPPDSLELAIEFLNAVLEKVKGIEDNDERLEFLSSLRGDCPLEFYSMMLNDAIKLERKILGMNEPTREQLEFYARMHGKALVERSPVYRVS